MFSSVHPPSPSRSSLPIPSPEAAAHSARVAEHIRGAIKAAGGWIGFDRYMDLALYAPGLGYYASGRLPFGLQGDFVTAPEQHPAFAQTLARQIMPIMEQSAPRILEFGAGSGRLAADLLTELGTLGWNEVQYEIVEVSAALQTVQKETLTALCPQALERVRWRTTLPEAFVGCVVGNEVLDAMPVHLFHQGGTVVQERGVGVDAEGQFCWVDRPASDTMLQALPPLGPHPNFVSELPLASHAFMRTMGAWLKQGAALLIDYGFPEAEFYHPQRDQGSLICHYRHRTVHDPFQWPGLMDITAHVDFSRVARAAREGGLEVLGYTCQARFLLNAGLLDVLSAYTPGTDAYRAASQAVQQWVSEAEMGELFKVIALGRGVAAESLEGFASGDRSAMLNRNVE